MPNQTPQTIEDFLRDAKRPPEVTEWKPAHPKLASIAEYLRRVKDASLLGNLVVGDKGALLERLAYKEPLTTGKGETLHLRPETLEASDLVPGPAAIKKGIYGMATIGPVGARLLGDQDILRKMRNLSELLRKTNPKDWKLQRDIIEAEPGFYPIPRGRDRDPGAPHVRFGYELPEGIRFSAPQPAEVAYKEPLEYSLKAERLFKAYPSLRNFSLNVDPNLGSRGMYDLPGMKIAVSNDALGARFPQTLRHELMHHAQEVEGWPAGTSPKWARKELLQFPEEIDETIPREIRRQKDLAIALRDASYSGNKEHVEKQLRSLGYNLYRREAGEQLAEAAAVAPDLGGKISDHFTVDPHHMYDRRRLDRELQDFWRSSVQRQLEEELNKIK